MEFNLEWSKSRSNSFRDMTDLFQATSVGQYAIQLAKLSGLRVATTASEKKWDLVKGLGADVVVDYKVGMVCECQLN